MRSTTIYKGAGIYKTGETAAPSEDYAEIGGSLYKTTKIGDQVWLAENLDYKFNGLHINDADAEYDLNPIGVYFDNDEITYGRSGKKYGMMYNEVARRYLEDNRDTLTPGWHIPTEEEFEELESAVGGASVAGLKLKSTTGWSSGNGDGSTDFNMPAGGISQYGSTFMGEGTAAMVLGQSSRILYFTVQNSSMITQGVATIFAYIRLIKD